MTKQDDQKTILHWKLTIWIMVLAFLASCAAPAASLPRQSQADEKQWRDIGGSIRAYDVSAFVTCYSYGSALSCVSHP